ncbi:MAG: hypothetical protein A2Z42_00705 [Candidatus Woykebacteria bacterium RBG_19FT_COMBO_43_10]|uniref:Uncharacterized protein n=1 Tax=Candidatus Woykebacteria bacterium RBG_19FT_COMBO_43_10 TaxID=1802598 RepID=A0A1G1WHR0_9BACT|nr:MAG: hypothetical protein A2Z42_00705 [Candidatus Woykebacteria bacterium RBG_19FT_COMBO_43_10]
MVEELSASEALKRKSPDFRSWMAWGRKADSIKVLEGPCPKCGSTAICAYADMGSPDFYDTFAHVCLNPDCEFSQEKGQFASNFGGRTSSVPIVCHFCGRVVA